MSLVTSFKESLSSIAVIENNRLLLAGGVEGQGSISTYKATVVCYDFHVNKIVWKSDRTKCSPFTDVAEKDGVCGAIQPFKFDNRPRGLFRFDTNTGEPLPEIQGSAKSILAGPHGFVYSRIEYPPDTKSVSSLRVTDVRGDDVQCKTFPTNSPHMSREIQSVVWAGSDSFLVHFCEYTNKAVDKVEYWEIESSSPKWVERVSYAAHGDVFLNGSDVVCWDSFRSVWGTETLKIELFSLDNRRRHRHLKFRLSEVVTVHPIDSRLYVVGTRSGLHMLDLDTVTLSPIPGVDPDVFLDFVGLAVDQQSRKIFMANGTAYVRSIDPKTNLSVIDY